jgi:hypothetical protein
MLTLFLKNFFTLKPTRDNNISTDRARLGLLAILITQMADFASTTYGLANNATEANGVMAQFISEHGIFAFFMLKFVASIFLGFSSYKRKYAPWIISGIYFIVVLWNLFVIYLLNI